MDEIKTERLQMRIDKETKEHLEWLAGNERRTLSGYVRAFVAREYKRVKKEQENESNQSDR